MKNIPYLIFILIANSSLNAQIWFNENFDSTSFPPEGWTIDAQAESWKYAGANYAGGKNGEVKLQTSPIFEGTTRLISPEINITDASNLSLSFKHTLRLYQAGMTIGVATRTANGEWTSVWQMDGTTTIKAEVDIVLENQTNASDFQFCFYFIGQSASIKYWAIDDILLYNKKEHDIATIDIMTVSYFEPNDNYTPVSKIYNRGLNSESFELECQIISTNGSVLYTDTQSINSLDHAAYLEVEFSPFTLPSNPDEAYQIIVNSMLENDTQSENNSYETYIYTYVTHAHEMVVVEIGTATWCSACPYAAEAADQIIQNGYNIAVIEHHLDDDYSLNTTENRLLDYYTMYGFPTAQFDGVDEQVGAGPNFYNNYFMHYYLRSIKKTGIGIALTSQKSEDGYALTLSISKLAPANNPNAVVQLVLTESHIPVEWMGEDTLNFVTRLLLPDENGTQINLAQSDEIILEYELEIDETWNFDNLEIVAFVQDNDTHEILNATKSDLSDLIGIKENAGIEKLSLSSFPNPFSIHTSIQFELKETEMVKLEIFDLTGKSIATLLDKKLENGKHTILWQDNNKIPRGIYFLNLTTNKYCETIKIIKQ